jgi:hypothetical protein
MKLFNEPEQHVAAPSAVPQIDLSDDAKELLRQVDFSGLHMNPSVQKVVDQIQQENIDLDTPLGDPANGVIKKTVKYNDLKGDERTVVNKLLRSVAIDVGADKAQNNPDMSPQLAKEAQEASQFMDVLFDKLRNHINNADNAPQQTAAQPAHQPTAQRQAFTPPPAYKPAVEAPEEPEITDQDKQRFIVSILANEPYSETVELFNGSMSVTYKTLNVQTLDMIACALSYITADITVPSLLKTSFVVKYSMAAQIVSIEVNGQQAALPAITPTNDFQKLSQQFLDRYNAITKSIANAPIITAITDNIAVFNKKCQFLSQKAFDENFWTPIQ